MSVAIVVPVYGNAATLPELTGRLAAALNREAWVVRFVVDGCPAGSGAVADQLAGLYPHVHVTHLAENAGQHAAIIAGLRAEPAAEAWVVLDADLQDPPEAIPQLLTELRRGAVAGVFAGRRGTYQGRVRGLTGDLHRRALHTLTGLPADAGAYFAMSAALRSAVLDRWDHAGAPSVVAAAGVSGLPLTSVPVARDVRTEGESAWTSRARMRQGVRTVRWAAAQRRAAPPGFPPSPPSTPKPFPLRPDSGAANPEPLA